MMVRSGGLVRQGDAHGELDQSQRPEPLEQPSGELNPQLASSSRRRAEIGVSTHWTETWNMVPLRWQESRQ